MFGQQLVSFSKSHISCRDQQSPLDLLEATIVVDANDFVGVGIASEALAEDVCRVRRTDARAVFRPSSPNDCSNTQIDTAIIIGTIESSFLIQQLVEQGNINVESVRNKWECFHTALIENPTCLNGCRNAFVIAGSDKRGTIYGIYTLSEQMGVSPWHWWADVPVKYHKEVYALPTTTSSAEPSVKYRGIFINDEAPALTGLVLEKFGNYGKDFYIKVFDLLLRLKANFMWPAMWPGYPNPGSSFFVDDAENQRTADDYGIIISTSHHEPMQRATNEWFATNPDGSWSWIENREKITDFFREGITRAEGHESYFTMGMRGEYDKSMKVDDPAAVVQDVLKTQRSLIKEVHGREDAVPQLLALYKEVQEYWDNGSIDVPDDVTLLFADDNFGALRRLPSGNEINRKGGAGIYYHFEYVGTPRSYKWINSNCLGKTWHQLQEAHRRNARQIWVFNIGDIKPMEVPLTFAMALAWDINSIPAHSFLNFYKSLAEHNFGPDLSTSVAEIWSEYSHLVSIRRHEHIEANDFSLLHYDEATTIEQRWKSLLKIAEDTYTSKVPNVYKPSYFQLILHPVKASTIYVSLRIRQAQNQLWAAQRRNTANKAAQDVLDLFDADFALSEEFHTMLDGKWNHIMCQTHYGFNETWHAPSRDMISGLCFVQARQHSNPVVGQLGVAVEGHPGVRPGVCNEESDRTHPSRRDLVPGVTFGAMTPYGPSYRWFEIYLRGPMPLSWSCTATHDWINLSHAKGDLIPGQSDVRVHITIDWDKVPVGFDETVLITVRSQNKSNPLYIQDFENLHFPLRNERIDPNSLFTGFIESDGYISIPAALPTIIPDQYRVLMEAGRFGIGAISIDPAKMPDQMTAVPFLSYDIYIFRNDQPSTLNLYFNMTLDSDPEELMHYEIGIDDNAIQRHRLLEDPVRKGELPPGWYHAVQDCIWHRKHSIGILDRGHHVIRIKIPHHNIVLEKIVVDMGGLKPSYLGPPPSTRLNTGVWTNDCP